MVSWFGFKRKPRELLNCWLPPCIPVSLSFSFSFFLNKTLLESKVYFESQVILGVYQKEKLEMFKNNSLQAGQLKKITPRTAAKEPRCATGIRAVCVHFSHFHVFKSLKKHSEQGRMLRVCERNQVVSLVSNYTFSSDDNLSPQDWILEVALFPFRL